MIGLLAFFLPLTLFLSFPSTFWNFDGVACAAALELGRPEYFFHANHLLYGFFGFIFWRFVAAPLGMVRALPALQLFCSLLSAAGLVGLYRTLKHVLTPTRDAEQRSDQWVALLLTFALASTAAFWVWSIEAQVYPLGFIALAWATAILVGSNGPHKYFWVGLLHAAAILGHQMHFLWIVPALYWMSREPRGMPQHLWAYLGTVAAGTVIPYMIVLTTVIMPAHDHAHVLIWLKGSAGLTPDRHWAWHGRGWTGPLIWLKSTAQAFWGSFWPYGNASVSLWLWVVTFVSVLILVFLIVRVWRYRRNDDSLVGFSLLWLLTYGIFLSTWEPATLCYRMPDIIPWGLLMAIGLKSLKTEARYPVVILMAVSLLTVNFVTQINPMRDVQKNRPYQEVLTLSKITSPDSLYITEGGLTWMYLLYFTGRTAWNKASMDPERLSQALSQQKKVRPVYLQKETSWEQVR